MYDASGYYSGSIYAGNNIRRGNAQLCRELNNELMQSVSNDDQKSKSTRSMYEEVQDFMLLPNQLPFAVRLINAKYSVEIFGAPFDSYVIEQIVCMPTACSHDDLMQVMSFANVPHIRNNLIMKNAQLEHVKIINESYQFHQDPIFFIFL